MRFSVNIITEVGLSRVKTKTDPETTSDSEMTTEKDESRTYLPVKNTTAPECYICCVYFQITINVNTRSYENKSSVKIYEIVFS